MKRWWARIPNSTNPYRSYGSWYPTPCTDLDEAKAYARSYWWLKSHTIVEWMQL